MASGAAFIRSVATKCVTLFSDVAAFLAIFMKQNRIAPFQTPYFYLLIKRKPTIISPHQQYLPKFIQLGKFQDAYSGVTKVVVSLGFFFSVAG